MTKSTGVGPGGARPGAGRKPLPRSKRRDNRVVVMLTDAEVRKLRRLAREAGEPVGVLAYGVVSRFLRRS